MPIKYNLESINYYLIEKKGSLTLIDAGIDNDECWEQLIGTIKEIGFTMADLDRIILTHSHEDHIGLVNRITSVKEVPVYTHIKSIQHLKKNKNFINRRIGFFEKLYREMGCGIAGEQQVQKLKDWYKKSDGDEIKADLIPLIDSDAVNGLTVIETPGHSPDHIVLYDEQQKRVFVGDQILNHISSNAIIEPDQKGNRIFTLVQYIQSLKKCLLLDAEVFYPGHGEFITNHKELIQIRLRNINEKASKIMKLIKEGVPTANQLALTYYKDKYQSEFSLVISEIIGYLDYLETEKKIDKELKNGIWHYHTT